MYMVHTKVSLSQEEPHNHINRHSSQSNNFFSTLPYLRYTYIVNKKNKPINHCIRTQDRTLVVLSHFLLCFEHKAQCPGTSFTMENGKIQVQGTVHFIRYFSTYNNVLCFIQYCTQYTVLYTVHTYTYVYSVWLRNLDRVLCVLSTSFHGN